MTATYTCCRAREDVAYVDVAIRLHRLIRRQTNNTMEFHEALKDMCADREFRSLLLYCWTRGYLNGWNNNLLEAPMSPAQETYL